MQEQQGKDHEPGRGSARLPSHLPQRHVAVGAVGGKQAETEKHWPGRAHAPGSQSTGGHDDVGRTQAQQRNRPRARARKSARFPVDWKAYREMRVWHSPVARRRRVRA